MGNQDTSNLYRDLDDARLAPRDPLAVLVAKKITASHIKEIVDAIKEEFASIDAVIHLLKRMSSCVFKSILIIIHSGTRCDTIVWKIS